MQSPVNVSNYPHWKTLTPLLVNSVFFIAFVVGSINSLGFGRLARWRERNYRSIYETGRSLTSMGIFGTSTQSSSGLPTDISGMYTIFLIGTNEIVPFSCQVTFSFSKTSLRKVGRGGSNWRNWTKLENVFESITDRRRGRSPQPLISPRPPGIPPRS